MPGKMSVFFMHDDGRSVRWRMGISLLRVLVMLAVVLPIVVVGSVFLNWRLLEERRALQEEVSKLEQQLDLHAQTSVRLANLEQFLERNAPDRLNKLVVSMAPELPVSIQQGGALTEETLAAMEAGRAEQTAVEASREGDISATEAEGSASPEQAVSSGSEEPAVGSVLDPATDSVAGSEPGATSDSAGENAIENSVPAEDPTAETPEEGAFIPGNAYPEVLTEDPVDTGYARVENLSARKVGTRSLRISFELFNTERVPQLAGKAAFDLVLPDGRVYPLSSQGDTQYRINRLKQIKGNPTLPPEVTDVTDAKIRVSVYADEGLIYRVLVPLQQ